MDKYHILAEVTSIAKDKEYPNISSPKIYPTKVLEDFLLQACMFFGRDIKLTLWNDIVKMISSLILKCLTHQVLYI